jgi:acetyl esterase/lipase
MVVSMTGFREMATAEGFTLQGLLSAVVSEGGVDIEKNRPYGASPRQRADIYRPKRSAERAPIIVFYYGGGWTSGNRAAYAFVGAALAAQGYTTVIPDYRLYPEVVFPAFIDDAAAAYAWTAQTLGKTCKAARPVIVIGHSAGAYIAAMLALNRDVIGRNVSDPPSPTAWIGLAGPYAFDPTTWPSTKAIFAPAAGNSDAARPIAFARRAAPPALLLHGLDDATVKLYNSRDLSATLKSHLNSVESVEYSGIGHAGLVLALAKPLRWRAPVLRDIFAFLKAQGGATMLSANCPSSRADSRP